MFRPSKPTSGLWWGEREVVCSGHGWLCTSVFLHSDKASIESRCCMIHPGVPLDKFLQNISANRLHLIHQNCVMLILEIASCPVDKDILDPEEGVPSSGD